MCMAEADEKEVPSRESTTETWPGPSTANEGARHVRSRSEQPPSVVRVLSSAYAPSTSRWLPVDTCVKRSSTWGELKKPEPRSVSCPPPPSEEQAGVTPAMHSGGKASKSAPEVLTPPSRRAPSASIRRSVSGTTAAPSAVGLCAGGESKQKTA